MEKQRIKKYLVFFIIIIFIAVIIFVLFNQGVPWFNNPLQSQYPVKGWMSLRIREKLTGML